MKNILISIILVFSWAGVVRASSNHFEEISSEAREVVALQHLKNSKDLVQIYARGLICESCAIGIRKNLQKLEFVDVSQPKKGIVLDVQNQLISLAIMEGALVDATAIRNAILDAGYDPIALYELTANDELKVTSLIQ